MANFAAVNKAIKKAYPTLDIQAVRCKGYVFFDGNDGFDKIGSIYSHPTSTTTETMIRFCLREINQATVALDDEWQEFEHAGQRWSFDSDQLARWDEAEGHFEFLAFHGLAEPTVESLIHSIDQL